MPHAKFKERSPEQVLYKKFLKDYEKDMTFFFEQIVHLNTSLYVLEQVLKFPFHLLVFAERTVFWSFVRANFYRCVILDIAIITETGQKKGKRQYPLHVFANIVGENVKKRYRKSYQRYLRKEKFDENAKKIEEKVTELRNNHIAHHLLPGNGQGAQPVPSEADIALTLSEISTIRTYVNRLFDAVSFSHSYGKSLYFRYIDVPSSHNERKSDIEELLIYVAKQSPNLQGFAKDPEGWTQRQLEVAAREPKVVEQEQKLLVHWRERCNL